MKRISRAAAERAYKLAAELHASRGAKLDGSDVSQAAREAGIAPGQLRRALATVRQEKSKGARKNLPGTRSAETLVAAMGPIAAVIFGAAAVATIRDGLGLLSASAYLGAVVVLAMGAGMLVIAANQVYQSVAAVRERSKTPGE
jgi:hypothetical protein